MSMQIYNSLSVQLSQKITKTYTTSFSIGILLFPKRTRDAIHSLYGFVRLADEIVDTFHDWDKQALLCEFREETDKALERGISINPVLQAFQQVVKEYSIERELINDFLDSMEMDLTNSFYDEKALEKYVYGSAEVVGLMCLRIFTKDEPELFDSLKAPAKSLGAAFQKVNFLRDIRSDLDVRKRIYLPDVADVIDITDERKRAFEDEIRKDFDDALDGIMKLPSEVRQGVYTAYFYYRRLFEKIQRRNIKDLLKSRIRISNVKKFFLLLSSYFKLKIVGLFLW